MSSKYLLFSILIAFLGFLSSKTKGINDENSQSDVSKFCGRRFRKINAAFRGPNNFDYIFVNDRFVINGATGEKKLTKNVFKGIKKVDAAVYAREEKKIYLIEDNKLWEFSENFEKIKDTPSPVDMGPQDGRVSLLSVRLLYIEIIILIKDLKYWLFFPIKLRSRNPENGINIKDRFNNAPYPLDAAISDGLVAYFLSGHTCTKQKLETNGSVTEEINDTRFLRCFKYA